LDELEKDINTFNLNQQVQERSINEVIELTHVLSADAVFFAQVSGKWDIREIKMERAKRTKEGKRERKVV
jgi:hypothetical protein